MPLLEWDICALGRRTGERTPCPRHCVKRFQPHSKPAGTGIEDTEIRQQMLNFISKTAEGLDIDEISEVEYHSKDLHFYQ